MSVRTTYKILVDPKTFEFVVVEIKIPETFQTIGMKKRTIGNEELATWTKEEFLERMSEFGYGYAAKSYMERYAIDFSCGQQP